MIYRAAVLALAMGLANAAAAADVESCLAKALPNAQVDCLAEIAKAEDDVAPCLAADKNFQWMCVASYAEHKGDESHCGALAPDEGPFPTMSLELCRTGLAGAWNRADLCAGMQTPNLSDACFQKLVENGADPAMCERTENPMLKDACAND